MSKRAKIGENVQACAVSAAGAAGPGAGSNILEVQNLGVSFGNLPIVKDVSFSLPENHWLMLIGPNGAGKSTVINAISQGVAYRGQILFEGQDVRHFKSHLLARRIGVLAQSHTPTYSFSVGEVVRLGRYAYRPGILSSGTDEDEESVKRALELTGMDELKDQSVLTLSGGELQRTFLAQVFAQDPRVLILDEPTNHLDLIFQKQVFQLIQEWNKEPGRAVISVVHDLSLARSYGSDALLLNHGCIAAAGSVESVFSRENLQAVYAMDVFDWMQELLGQWQCEK